MKLRYGLIVGLLALPVVSNADPGAIVPVTTNKDDSPERVKSGKVFASTDTDLPPALGPSPAKVIVIVFSDFECPVCRRTADATQQIPEEFPGEVRVEFWQHPLTTHAGAESVAVASLAAQRQGKFWEFHDELFRNQGALDATSVAGYAARLGLEPERFKNDCAAPGLRTRVQEEAAFAEKFGAVNTPAFMINGKVKSGWGSWYGFKADVERELAEARKLEVDGASVEQIAERRARIQIDDNGLFQAYREQVLHIAPDPPPPPVTGKKEKHKKGKTIEQP